MNDDKKSMSKRLRPGAYSKDAFTVKGQEGLPDAEAVIPTLAERVLRDLVLRKHGIDAGWPDSQVRITVMARLNRRADRQAFLALTSELAGDDLLEVAAIALSRASR